MPLIGESFRIGKQGSRSRGGIESIPLQKLASYSHLRFIKYMKAVKNIDIDVVFISYKETDEELNALEMWYSDYLVNKIYYDSKCSTEEELYKKAGDFLKSIAVSEKYDYIFLMRFDFYIKLHFQNVLFKINPEKVIYCFPDLNGYINTTCWKYIGHNCMIIPNKFFNYITNGSLWTKKHESIHYLISVEGNNSYEILVNTPHYSSSCLGYNPFYTMVGRVDYHKYDIESDKNKDIHMHSYKYDTNIYDNIINTDTLGENLAKHSFSSSLLYR